MFVLAINCGSSSLKCSLIDSDSLLRSFDSQVENIHGDHAGAMQKLLDELRHASDHEPEAVAHRIVHGGDRFLEPTRVTEDMLASLTGLNELAPLHNPPAIAALKLARAALASIPHVAVFDTSFHATLPPHAYEYALPSDVSKRYGIRRYGFHGISHAHVMQSVATHLGKQPDELRIVSCHLGNGASVAAIERGRSVETSMGMTPLEGLVMGTRSGDIDPGALLHLLHSGDYDVDKLDSLLNQQAGMQGLTGTNDLRAIEGRAANGDESCTIAIDIYAHRVRKYIGAYAAVMGGVDVIAFTGGVGEHSISVRARVLQRLEFLGVQLDDSRNRAAIVGHDRPSVSISRDDSSVRVVVVQADEEAAMAKAAAALLSN